MKRSLPLERARRAAAVTTQGVNQALAGVFEHLGMADDVPALTVACAAGARAPAALAAAHPPEARAEARSLYERCLAHYRRTIRPDDTARGFDDVGAAAAAFVAANLEALHGESPTADGLVRLERQLGAILRASPAWVAADARTRQTMFERFAILAVLVAETFAVAAVQGQAAVAHVQRGARAYLQELLGLDPQRLRIGPNGLSLA